MRRVAVIQRPPVFLNRAETIQHVVGHYSRPDIFRLHVNTSPFKPVEFVPQSKD
jgi:hypothetical protein